MMDNKGSDGNRSSEAVDPVVLPSDLEFTTVEEKPSDYVSALVRYDSFRFEKTMNATARDILNESCSDYYSTILNVSSLENTFKSGCNCDSVTDLLRARSFELTDTSVDSSFSFEKVPEEYEFDVDSLNCCDICYSSLGDLSKSTCKTCKITSHTSCLLNSCNTITELAPVNTKRDLEMREGSSFRVKDYEYLCKICATKLPPSRRPRCSICNTKGGVLNLTDKVYYHPFCVYYSYDVLHPYFNNNLILSNSPMFRSLLSSSSDKEKVNLEERKCIICGDHTGVTIKCKFLTCNNYLHSRCIVRSNSDESRTAIPGMSEREDWNLGDSGCKPPSDCGKKGLVLFMIIKHTSNLGGKNMLFRASFCGEHTSKKYINYSIYKQLLNQSILTPTNQASYSKYRHTIDNILKKYFVKSSNLNFNINTSINIPKIVDTEEHNRKRRKLDDILTKIESKLRERVDESTKDKETSNQQDREDVNLSVDEDLVIFEPTEPPIEKKADLHKAEGESKDDKDKKEEEDLKVQKVLWQKFDIFNPITFNPFTSNYYRRETTSSLVSSASQNAKSDTKGLVTKIEDTHDDAPLLSVLLYNKEVKDNILPLNSILFDNIKSNRELSICYQQKILTSCSGIIEYLNILNRSLVSRDDDEMQIFTLFENVVCNYLLVYSISRKMLSSMSTDEFKAQMQHDLKSLLTNSSVRESSMKENPLFSNVNMYGIKDDIKYIHSILSGSGVGGGSLSKSKQLTKKLRLSQKIKLNNFEMELLKRSILEIRNINYIKLIVVNKLTSLQSYRSNGAMCAPPSMYMEEKYINYIDWNKVVHNIKGLYEKNDTSTPLKYDEYRLLTHFNAEFNREKEQLKGQMSDGQFSYANNEYKSIEAELDSVNADLIKIKNKLHEKILEYCSEHCMDHDKQIKDRNHLNKYEFNEYYYYVLYNMSKLFSEKNKLNLPNLDRVSIESFKKGTVPIKKMATEHHVGEGAEDESRFCQVCYNEEENNINVLIKCARCLIVVHKYCYNVPQSKILRNTEYLCNRCEYEKKQLSSQYQSNYKKFSILCCICKRGSGPLTRAKDEWYHPFCYLILLMTPGRKKYLESKEVTIDTTNKSQKNGALVREEMMEEVSSDIHEDYGAAPYELYNVKFEHERMQVHENEVKGQEAVEPIGADQESVREPYKRCVVCGIGDGVLVECDLCSTRFHPFCAYFHGFKFQLVNEKGCIQSYTNTRISITCNEHFTMSDLEGECEPDECENKHSGKSSEHNSGRAHKKSKQRELAFKESEESKHALWDLEDKAVSMEIITAVMNNRYRRYINRDVNDTIYDKDKKKRIIHNAPFSLDDTIYDAEPKKQPDNTCNVCFGDNGEVCCTSCSVYVHKSCYPQQINNGFKCDQCTYTTQSSKDKKATYCYICLNNDPLLIKLYDNMYYHIICKIIYNCSDNLSPDIYYLPEKDKYQLYTRRQMMRDRTDVDNEVVEAYQRKGERSRHSGCNICKGEYGLMVFCYKNSCPLKFHPNCAIKNKLILETHFTTNGLKYISLCHEHSLLHNTVGTGLKNLLRLRVQLMMTRNIFKDLHDQNLVLKSMLRKRNEIYNLKYPLDKIYKP